MAPGDSVLAPVRKKARIAPGALRQRDHVSRWNPQPREGLLQVFLEDEPCVIGADSYSHGAQLYSTLRAS